MKKIGFIGLGNMGYPMAANLARGNALKSVWNRTTDKAMHFAESFMVKQEDDCASLARECDLIIICVSADNDVLEIIEKMGPGLSKDTIVIDTSTISPESAKKAALQLNKHDCHFLDAPVSGGIEGAKNGSLSMMVGGCPDILATVKTELAFVAAKITHMGPVGSGQGTKAVNQIMAAGINQAVTEALAFGCTLGLDMDKVVDVVSAGAAGNWFLEHRGKTMLQGQFNTGFKLALHLKDLQICQDSAALTNQDLPITSKTCQDYQALIQQGYSDEDISALFRLKHNLQDN